MSVVHAVQLLPNAWMDPAEFWNGFTVATGQGFIVLEEYIPKK